MISTATLKYRGVFRISSRGWQSNFQGVAKIPKGWRKNCALPPSAFDILDTCYKEIHTIYFLLFLVRLLSFNASLIPHNVLCFEGVEISSNGQGVARGAAPPHWNRLPTEIASVKIYLMVNLIRSWMWVAAWRWLRLLPVWCRRTRHRALPRGRRDTVSSKQILLES